MYTLCVCVHWPVDLKWFFFSRSLRGAVHFINPQYISVQFHFILDIRYIHWYIYSFNSFFLLRVTKMFSLIFSIWFLSRYSQFRFFIQAFHRAFNHFTNFPHLNLFDNSIFFYFSRMTFVKANMGKIRSRPLCCGLKCILRLHSVIFFFIFIVKRWQNSITNKIYNREIK